MAPVKKNFKIYQGSTFSEVLRWESSTTIYKNITAITKTAPVVITAVAHGLVAGWRAKISNVSGMKEINSEDYAIVTDVTTDTITFGSINASGYTTYTSGGIIEYNQPVSLSAYTARMQLRSKVSSPDVILELNTTTGGIAIDNVNKTILLTISATATAALSFKTAVYSLEMINGTTVIPLINGNFTLESEITR
jgi:hypothetical protein